MDVVFRTKKLEKCYLKHACGQKAWGLDVAAKYIQCINLLLEALDMEEIRKLPVLDCHPLKGKLKEKFGITIQDRWRMIISLQGSGVKVIQVEEVNRHYGD